MTIDTLSWLELSRANLLHNLAGIRTLVGHTRIIAVLKANAYGAGAAGMARVLASDGITSFAVATVAEAIELRASGIRGSILCLTYFTEREAADIVAHDLSPGVFTREALAWLAAAAVKRTDPLDVWVKIDTGLGRIGVRYPEAAAFVREANATAPLRVSGLFSTVVEDSARDPEQVKRLLAVRRELSELSDLTLSIASSHSILSLPASYLDAVRPGIMLLGLEPSERERLDMRVVERVALRPIVTWKARIGFVKTVPGGEQVGYGTQSALASDTQVATIAAGWADGCPPQWHKGGQVLVRGVRCRVMAVSANSTMVDISAVPQARLGEEAVLLGMQGPASISPYELAESTGSVYRLLATIPRSVPRLWL